jgi:hypothetical protein
VNPDLRAAAITELLHDSADSLTVFIRIPAAEIGNPDLQSICLDSRVRNMRLNIHEIIVVAEVSQPGGYDRQPLVVGFARSLLAYRVDRLFGIKPPLLASFEPVHGFGP